MNARELLQSKFPNIKIPKRRSEKVKSRLVKKFVNKRGISLIHKQSYESVPKKGLLHKLFGASPASYQTKNGKRMQRLVIEELKSDPNTKKVCEKISNSPLQICILYTLVDIKKKRDIDNYTKNIIDSLRKGGLFKDDNNHQVKFIASKVEYLDIKDKSYYRASEKFIVFLDFFNDESNLIKEFNLIYNK